MGCTVRPKFDLRLLPPSPTLDFEQELWQRNFSTIAGLDEAGRGALAGPLYAAAVILPENKTSFLLERLSGVRDSKQLSAKKREEAESMIKSTALAWGIGVCSAAEIDDFGMAKAGRLVFARALESLPVAPDYLLIDYFRLPAHKIPQTALVKGDARSLSIACASILAKTARDAVMRELDQHYPVYGFAVNKGYGTRTHRHFLLECGTCPEHRQSFRLFKIPPHS